MTRHVDDPDRVSPCVHCGHLVIPDGEGGWVHTIEAYLHSPEHGTHWCWPGLNPIVDAPLRAGVAS